MMPRTLPTICVFFAALLLGAATASACTVPVFRYALDNWKPDTYRLEIPASAARDPSLAPILRNLGDSSPLNLQAASQPASTGDALLLFPARTAAQVWSGALDRATFSALTDSPARREIIHRILSGESIVWAFVGSGKKDADDAVVTRLEKRLAFLEHVATIPQIDPNDPTSQLGPGPELRVKFSVVRVSADDPAEAPLRTMLAGPKQVGMRGEPLLAPIFGRGRVLGAWPASEMGDEQIEEATLFLLGACSCQVKSQNPGWDLLLAVEWDRELQAIGSGARTTGLQSRAQSSAVMPVAVTIRGNDEAPNIPTTSARTKKIVQIGAGGLLLIGGALAWFRIRKHA